MNNFFLKIFTVSIFLIKVSCLSYLIYLYIIFLHYILKEYFCVYCTYYSRSYNFYSYSFSYNSQTTYCTDYCCNSIAYPTLSEACCYYSSTPTLSTRSEEEILNNSRTDLSFYWMYIFIN